MQKTVMAMTNQLMGPWTAFHAHIETDTHIATNPLLISDTESNSVGPQT